VVLLLLAPWFLLAGQACRQAKAKTHTSGSTVVEISVPLGKTVGNFTFSKSGLLSYQGKSFSPAVKVRPDSVRSFRISLPKDKGLAGAIAEDEDGKNSLYLLELAARTAIPLPEAEAQKIFWSPSGRYMLAYCSYEGEAFLGVDLETQKVVQGQPLGPEGKMWNVIDEPRWAKGADTLVFTVDETCDIYSADSECNSDRTLAKYVVSLDPATMKTTAQKLRVRGKKG